MFNLFFKVNSMFFKYNELLIYNYYVELHHMTF